VSLDEFCSSDQWSMLTSASDHSKLAAALGGFLITAIALYLKGEVRESVHTLALFSSAVLILVLSAFLSSLITGTVVPADAQRDGICAIVWAQGALATAMLAAGTAALFGGLGWMLAGHAISKMPADADEDAAGYTFLTKLGTWLTFAATMTTTLLLSETSIDYVHFAFGGTPPGWLVDAIGAAAAAVVVTSLVFVVRRSRALRLAEGAEPTRLTLGALKVATVCLVVLAITASWLALTLARFPKDWLTTPGSPVMYAVLLLTFGLPAVVGTAICYSAPSTDQR
jgi:hypothetical protein